MGSYKNNRILIGSAWNEDCDGLSELNQFVNARDDIRDSQRSNSKPHALRSRSAREALAKNGYVGAKRAATILGVSVSKLRRLQSQGLIKVHPDYRLYYQPDLDALVERNKKEFVYVIDREYNTVQ